MTCCNEQAAGLATSSTSATACCPTHPSKTCRHWPSTFTRGRGYLHNPFTLHPSPFKIHFSIQHSAFRIAPRGHHRRRRHFRPRRRVRACDAPHPLRPPRGVGAHGRARAHRTCGRLHHRRRCRLDARDQARRHSSSAKSSASAPRLMASTPPRTAYVHARGRLHALPSPSIFGIPTTWSGIATYGLLPMTARARLAWARRSAALRACENRRR